jgi:hypothetical protein
MRIERTCEYYILSLLNEMHCNKEFETYNENLLITCTAYYCNRNVLIFLKFLKPY